jgi:hypothetical protein
MKLKLEELKLKSFVTGLNQVKGGDCTGSGATVCGQECTCIPNTEGVLCTSPYQCQNDYTFGEGVCGPH